MNVSEIMSEEVHTISPDFSVKKAAQAMSREKIGSLIVVSDTKLEGIITERDILSKVVSLNRNADKVKVRDVMTKDIIFIEPDTDVDDAAEKMVQNQIKKLPVVADNRLIGIITAMDIVTAEPKITEQVSSLVTFVKKKRFVAG
jgi:CBS domain-containing protein